MVGWSMCVAHASGDKMGRGVGGIRREEWELEDEGEVGGRRKCYCISNFTITCIILIE